MKLKAGAFEPNDLSVADVEIRAIVGKVDAWEVLSSARCCAFEWARVCGHGTLYVDSHHVHERCHEEIREYARRRGYRVEIR